MSGGAAVSKPWKKLPRNLPMLGKNGPPGFQPLETRYTPRDVFRTATAVAADGRVVRARFFCARIANAALPRLPDGVRGPRVCARPDLQLVAHVAGVRRAARALSRELARRARRAAAARAVAFPAGVSAPTRAAAPCARADRRRRLRNFPVAADARTRCARERPRQPCHRISFHARLPRAGLGGDARLCLGSAR